MLRPIELSARAEALQPSLTLAIAARAKSLRADGHDICSLSAGEPDFDTPAFIRQAATAALEAGHTRYGPAAGEPALRQAIAAKLSTENQVPTRADQVLVTNGGKQALYNLFQVLLGPGDELLLPSPYWLSYPEMVKLAGAKPVFLLADDTTGFRLTPEQLEAAITPRTRLLILNSPSNPTGAVYTKAQLEAIVAVALKHNLYILSDEIYEHLTYDGAKHHSPATFSAEAAARVIIVSGFAKTYAMTGWRLGTTVAPAPIAKAIAELQSQTTSNATTFAQYGALAALKESDKTQAALAQMLVAFDRRRKFLHAELNKIDGIRCLLAEGAFYLFPNISSFGLSSEDFCTRLLDQQRVAAVHGSAFGAEGYLRLSYATSDEIITKGVTRLAAFCATLRK